MKCPYCSTETFKKKPHLIGKLEWDRARVSKSEYDQYIKHTKFCKKKK